MNLNIIWEGADGSVWDLNDGPVRLTREGISGLGMLPTTASTNKTPTTDGQRLRGIRREPRPVGLPVMVNTTRVVGSWQAISRAWWRSFDEEEYGTLWVTDTLGAKRRIQLRFDTDNDYTFKIDPANLGYEIADIDLIADDPWFYGKTESFRIKAPTAPPNFFGPTGFGPDFYVSEATVTGRQSIHNPGDADAWPIYTQYGPSSAFIFTVQGRTVSGSIDVPEGSRLVIDTRQNQKTARVYDEFGVWTDVFRQLDTFDFARVPKGATVPITILTVGSGDVTVEFDPLFKRGF